MWLRKKSLLTFFLIVLFLSPMSSWLCKILHPDFLTWEANIFLDLVSCLLWVVFILHPEDSFLCVILINDLKDPIKMGKDFSVMVPFQMEMKLFDYTGLPFSVYKYFVLYPCPWPSVFSDPVCNEAWHAWCQGKVQIRERAPSDSPCLIYSISLHYPYLHTYFCYYTFSCFQNQRETVELFFCNDIF